MAVLTANLFSQSLGRLVPVTVVLPAEMDPHPEEAFPTVYLLHGFSGNHMDWLTGSCVAELAIRYRTAFVMPSGENSFYIDDEKRCALYEKWVTEELPALASRMFPLSKEREKTAIGGFSMGGYGALYCGLRHPETFGAVVALSSALISDQVAEMTPEDDHKKDKVMMPYSYYAHTFGLPAEMKGSDRDIKALCTRLAESGAPRPKLYLACGTEDFLIENNRELTAHLNSLGLEHSYTEGEGSHNWDYWNRHIRLAVEYISTGWPDGVILGG